MFNTYSYSELVNMLSGYTKKDTLQLENPNYNPSLKIIIRELSNELARRKLSAKMLRLGSSAKT
jgi:hypothetical protein